MITVNYLSSMKKYKYVFIVYDAKGEQVALQDIHANNEVQARRIMNNASLYTNETSINKLYTYAIKTIFPCFK